MNKILSAVRSFASDEEGSEIIEYALIIAVVSITLIVALRELNGGDFTTFIGRVGTCLTNGAACA